MKTSRKAIEAVLAAAPMQRPGGKAKTIRELLDGRMARISQVARALENYCASERDSKAEIHEALGDLRKMKKLGAKRHVRDALASAGRNRYENGRRVPDVNLTNIVSTAIENLEDRLKTYHPVSVALEVLRLSIRHMLAHAGPLPDSRLDEIISCMVVLNDGPSCRSSVLAVKKTRTRSKKPA